MPNTTHFHRFFLFFIAFAVLAGPFAFIGAVHAASSGTTQLFEVYPGEGAREISARLMQDGFIRSALGFYLVALFTGSAFDIKPGTYELDADTGSRGILRQLVAGPISDTEVRIAEGATIYEIDALLAEKNILPAGALVAYDRSQDESLEGRLFPDTYRLYAHSTTSDVVAKFLKNFETKALPVLEKSGASTQERLILASILEKEVPDSKDRRIVAGILLKRVEANMPLQVDAALCYAKQYAALSSVSCDGGEGLDTKYPSPYNTYEHTGWSPGPIGNPGLDAIHAAVDPIESKNWYYLSDPKTGKTIFSPTLDEHARNRVKYLAQ